MIKIRLIFDPTCVPSEQERNIVETHLTSFIWSKLNADEIPALRNIIIFGGAAEGFSVAFFRYAPPEEYCNFTNDGTYIAIGQTLCYCIDGKPLVDIYFDADFFQPLLDMALNNNTWNSRTYLATHYLTHELGHAEYYQRKINMGLPMKPSSEFDTRTPQGIDHFLLWEADTLLSEYFAERRSNRFFIRRPSSSDSITLAWNSAIGNDYCATVNSILGKAFRILYFAALQYGYIDTCNENNNYYDAFEAEVEKLKSPLCAFHKKLQNGSKSCDLAMHSTVCHAIGKILYQVAEIIANQKSMRMPDYDIACFNVTELAEKEGWSF